MITPSNMGSNGAVIGTIDRDLADIALIGEELVGLYKLRVGL